MSLQGKIGTLVMSRNDVFDWQSSPYIRGVVLVRAPKGAGDTYQFVYDDGKKERLIVLNGNSQDFVAFDTED